MPLARVIAARPDVFNHNVEVVPRLYPLARRGSHVRALGARPAQRQGAGRRRGHDEVGADGRPRRDPRGDGRVLRPAARAPRAGADRRAVPAPVASSTCRSSATGTPTSSRRSSAPPTSSASSTSPPARSCAPPTTPTSTCRRRAPASARSPRSGRAPIVGFPQLRLRGFPGGGDGDRGYRRFPVDDAQSLSTCCVGCGDRVGVYEPAWVELDDGTFRPSSRLGISGELERRGVPVVLWHLACAPRQRSWWRVRKRPLGWRAPAAGRAASVEYDDERTAVAEFPDRTPADARLARHARPARDTPGRLSGRGRCPRRGAPGGRSRSRPRR